MSGYRTFDHWWSYLKSDGRCLAAHCTCLSVPDTFYVTFFMSALRRPTLICRLFPVGHLDGLEHSWAFLSTLKHWKILAPWKQYVQLGWVPNYKEFKKEEEQECKSYDLIIGTRDNYQVSQVLKSLSGGWHSEKLWLLNCTHRNFELWLEGVVVEVKEEIYDVTPIPLGLVTTIYETAMYLNRALLFVPHTNLVTNFCARFVALHDQLFRH